MLEKLLPFVKQYGLPTILCLCLWWTLDRVVTHPPAEAHDQQFYLAILERLAEAQTTCLALAHGDAVASAACVNATQPTWPK